MKDLQGLLLDERVSMTWEQYQAMHALIKQLGEALLSSSPDWPAKVIAAQTAYNNWKRERGE